MDESDAANRLRRSPAQKAAQEKGLPPGVSLHEDAMGGFSASGRKLKRLKPGDLSAKPKKRRKPLVPAPAQTALPDNFPDDEVVLIPSIPARGPLLLDDEPDEDPETTLVETPQSASLEEAARSAVAQVLYHEIGTPNSLVQHPAGASFSIRPGLGEGQAHTRRRLQVPLPGGNSSGHMADLAIELDGGAILVLDLLSSESSLAQVKSHAFDALQLRGVSQCYAVLVFVQGHGGLERDHVEAIAHGYDHFFGVPADQATDPVRYNALRARVTQWIKAATKK